MQLHSFFASSTSFRVRIALALKSVPFECIPVNLRSSQQRDATHVAVNPAAAVPVLTDGEYSLAQSLAIIDYLDARFPQPRLLPEDAQLRGHVLELSLLVACDIHPLNNVRVQRYLKQKLNADDTQLRDWSHHWILEGMSAAETLLQRHRGAGPFCFGSTPTLADCCLIPQVLNSLRANVPMERFALVMSVYQHCMELPAFKEAAPANQVDYVDGPRAAHPQGVMRAN